MQWTVAPGEGVAGRVRALAPDGVDAVMDCVGQGVVHATADVGSSRLRACSIADGGPGIATVFARMDSAILSQLVEMVDAGRLRVPIAATYRWINAALRQYVFFYIDVRSPTDHIGQIHAGRFATVASATNALGVGDDVHAVALFLRDRASRSPHTVRAYWTELLAWGSDPNLQAASGFAVAVVDGLRHPRLSPASTSLI